MTKYREVSQEERRQMMEGGVFDINGNIPAHPGYTGIHRHRDGTYWFNGEQVTDASNIRAIEDYLAFGHPEPEPEPVNDAMPRRRWWHRWPGAR